jgi:hypothetical protein
MNLHLIKNRWSWFAITAVALAVLALVVSYDKLGGPLSAEKEEQVLKQRVRARWDAILADDWDQVYEFTTPAYREKYSKTHFFNQYGGQILRTGFEFRSITFENPERTQAKVVGTILFTTEAFGRPYHGRNYQEEHWTRVDGTWWHIERR